MSQNTTMVRHIMRSKALHDFRSIRLCMRGFVRQVHRRSTSSMHNANKLGINSLNSIITYMLGLGKQTVWSVVH